MPLVVSVQFGGKSSTEKATKTSERETSVVVFLDI